MLFYNTHEVEVVAHAEFRGLANREKKTTKKGSSPRELVWLHFFLSESSS